MTGSARSTREVTSPPIGDVLVRDSLWAAFDAVFPSGANRLAVVDDDGEHGSEVLRARAQLIAGGLITAGVRPGDRVMVRGVPCFELVAALLATSLAGGVCCPFNPQLGPREIAGLASVVEPALTIDPTGAQGAATATSDLVAAGALPTVPVGTPRSTDLALIGFTGGTTGVPKAVMHDMTALTYAVLGTIPFTGVGPEDTIIATLPTGSAPGFAFGIGHSLIVGSPIVLSPRFDAVKHLELIERHDVRWTLAVPTHVAMLTEAATAAGKSAPAAGMTAISVGGAPMFPAVVARWEEALGTPILRMYGMSECLGHCSNRLDEPVEVRRSRDGVPFEGWDVVAFAEDGETILPRGEPGICGVKGPSLFKGYYGQPELTRSKMTASGYYLPGDRIIRHEDGYVQAVGRDSDIIIRGGTNLDPHEIEEFLVAHVGVKEAVVVSYPDERLGERTWAAVIAPDDPTIDRDAVKQRFSDAQIASYKCPDRVTVVSAIPRTAMGKVDRKQLTKLLEKAHADAPSEVPSR